MSKSHVTVVRFDHFDENMSYWLTLWNLNEHNEQFILIETTVETVDNTHERVMRNPRTHFANQDDHLCTDLGLNYIQAGMELENYRNGPFRSCPKADKDGVYNSQQNRL